MLKKPCAIKQQAQRLSYVNSRGHSTEDELSILTTSSSTSTLSIPKIRAEMACQTTMKMTTVRPPFGSYLARALV